MPADEGDSGVDAMSLPESRDNSPKVQKADLDVPVPNIENPFARRRGEEDEEVEEDDEDFELDETLSERLWGLTEMFPEPVRKGTRSLVLGSFSSLRRFYGFSRAALWVLFSSSAILFAPVIFEVERLQMEELSRQQQRQILLGPSAAMSGGAGAMPGLNMLGGPQPQPSR
ncbi:unnamed protein product [Ixodes hexagonus]